MPISVEIVERDKVAAQTAATAEKIAVPTTTTAVPLIVKAKPAPPVAIKPRIEPASLTNGVKAFVPPRAPDDPGLDEVDDVVTPRADYVAKVPKRSH